MLPALNRGGAPADLHGMSPASDTETRPADPVDVVWSTDADTATGN